MNLGMLGSGDVTKAQVSVDDVLNLCVRFNAEATYTGLKDLFASEQVTVDALLK